MDPQIAQLKAELHTWLWFVCCMVSYLIIDSIIMLWVYDHNEAVYGAYLLRGTFLAFIYVQIVRITEYEYSDLQNETPRPKMDWSKKYFKLIIFLNLHS